MAVTAAGGPEVEPASSSAHAKARAARVVLIPSDVVNEACAGAAPPGPAPAPGPPRPPPNPPRPALSAAGGVVCSPVGTHRPPSQRQGDVPAHSLRCCAASAP